MHLDPGVRGEDYYVIRQIPHPILFKVINDSAVAWARSYNYQSSDGYMIEVDDAIYANNSFYIGTAINESYYPDSSYETSDPPYIIKTNAEGITPCSDSFPDAFTFIKLPLFPNQPLFFKESLAPMQFPASMYSKPLVPHGVIDCADITCCRDKVMYQNVSLCTGSIYSLPDGNMIDTAGVYPVMLKTVKHCDSVIFTKASMQPNIKVSLGNDTCFADVHEIKFKLSYPGEVKYLWQDGSSDSTYSASQPGQYWVRASTACNTSADSVIIYKDCNFPVYIPNAFTPNNDGVNDVFRIADMKGQQLIGLSIYNRYG